MNTRSRSRLSFLLLAGAGLAAAGLAAEGVRNHFDADTAGRVPGFFDMTVLAGPGPARWIVLTDLNPPSAPNKLVQVDAKRPPDSIAAAVRRNYSFQDGKVSTFVKQGGSRAGLILRMADDRDFVLLLVDTVSGEAVLSAWRDGKAAELGRASVRFDRGWEEFSVAASGPTLTVFFNDGKIFEAVDPKPVAGKTGLAAAGPGEASFDEFVIEPADAVNR